MPYRFVLSNWLLMALKVTNLLLLTQLISVSNLICRRRKATAISMADIRKAYTLFVDEKRTVQFLTEYQQEFLFDENNGEEEQEEGEEKEEDSTETMETA